MAMTKKKPKETKEFEKQYEEPETPKSPKAAQETGRQEFKGPFSSKMGELCNNILTAKKGRAAEMRAFMDDFQGFIGDGPESIEATKNGVRELGEETHDFLRSAEHNRIRGFNDFMMDTKGRIKEIKKKKRGFLKR